MDEADRAAVMILSSMLSILVELRVGSEVPPLSTLLVEEELAESLSMYEGKRM